MTGDWLAATNFERMHEVLSAINTLAIHAKLIVADVTDPTPDAEIEKARRRLLDFLEGLQTVVTEARQDGGGTVVGTDPQLGELALQFLDHPVRGEQRSRSSMLPLATMSDLLRSDRAEDLRRLIPHLQELRTLIEEQAHADVTGTLRDV